MRNQDPVAVIGGGVGGLSVAYELARRQVPCVIFEADETLGGLCGTFQVPGGRLEKFYHHWFNSDYTILNLLYELGLRDKLEARASRTGLLTGGRIHRLATPWDLLRFRPLSPWNRIRLGLLMQRARRETDSLRLDKLTAREWLISMAGAQVFRVVWEPLLRGKFGPDADNISAAWFCEKLKLRGGSRDGGAREQLLYMRGGFSTFIDGLAQHLRAAGVAIHANSPVSRVATDGGRVTAITTPRETINVCGAVVTTAIPPFLKMCPDLPADYRQRLEQVRYLGNVCIVLGLKHALSDMYWISVSEPSFPFVGIIEHTNLDSPAAYRGMHFVFLSRYANKNDLFFTGSKHEVIGMALPHLRRAFPSFDERHVAASFVHRTPYAQPIVTRGYRDLIPEMTTPIPNLWLSTMTQIYPQDRGTNYAIQNGRHVAGMVAEALSS
ncbi:MAG: NAD(P)/FAD-dependent oxidoreductase [Phycisphaerae bacterium]|nr:NAD(P)/FAD-dependent oxidoreductase [Phycisphaerae bacterium]